MPNSETLQTSTKPLQKNPTTEPQDISETTYPRTHIQAAARIRQHWQARQYAAAADYAALAHTLTLDAGDVQLAAKYAHARQLAHKYQALKLEMQKIDWNVANHPILEPDDPPSSEARFNMVCKPDRPHQFHQNHLTTSHPRETDNHVMTAVLPAADTVTPQQPSTQTLFRNISDQHFQVNPSQPILRYDEPRPAPGEMDIDGTVCCFPITWPPWRRKR